MPRTTSRDSAHRNFHVPLPDDLYRALQAEAEQAHVLAREAIAQWLEQRRQARIDQAILAYAKAVAGTSDDLDLALEAASLELLERER